jgi:hypothetical protein
VQQIGDDIECPSCRKVATIPAAGVSALQTNFYVKYIHSLVQGSWVPDSGSLECGQHPHSKLLHYCKDCARSVCQECCTTPDEASADPEAKVVSCSAHKKVPITTVTEEYHQKLDTAFSQANSMIEKKKIELEALLKALSEEKDQSLLKIDSVFEGHVHTLNRRATLLKNKVIDIYKGHVEKLEWGLDQTSWAMTCIVSLKEYHEKDISRGYFQDIDVGIYELNEVFKNISERVKPMENHIVFDDKHGMEKYRAAAKDLGRVQYSRPNIPRAEPEGGMVAPPDDPITPTNESSSPMIGAVGGHEEPYPSLISALNLNNEDISPAPKRKPLTLHSMSCDPEVLKRELGLAPYSNDPDNNGNPSAAALALNPPMLALSISTDKNSNAVAATGAVRPKSLDTKGKRSGPNIVRPVKGQRSGNTPPGRATIVKGEAAEEEDDDNPGGAAAAVPHHHPVLRHPPQDPDIERLKKDKMYHHLVYTSYDEEELLKELKKKEAQK